MSAILDAPRWDLTPAFPSLESPEFRSAISDLAARITNLETVFDSRAIDQQPAPADSAVATYEAVLPLLEQLNDKARLLSSYVHGFTSTDSRNEVAQAAQSELQGLGVRISRLGTRWTGWLGSQDVEALIAVSPDASDHAYQLKKAKVGAQHLMSPAEESLAAELDPVGSSAWAKLHGNLSSQIEVRVELKGESKSLPMSALRNVAYDADSGTRKAAYEAELQAWKDHELVMAACMNGVKGELVTLSKRRGWASPLDEALFAANIDRQTLDAMLGAARAAFPNFRRYLRAKAKALGHAGALPWYDLFAPMPGEGREWPIAAAQDLVAEQFDTFSSKMGDMARRAYAENWIDWTPRAGKRDGAFCMGFGPGDSRVLMNYEPTFRWVSTLAHELGHAYHNLCLKDARPLLRTTPMTLAETASIFCEQIIKKAGLDSAAPSEKLDLLETSLMGACQVVVDITSRFEFEHETIERRAARELSATEMCDIMRRAQISTYGDGLDGTALHPYMWAAKPHYYGRAFYNFPYMFGLLFSLGLYARYQADPNSFRAGFDTLLAGTGTADAATLAARFDIDIRDQAFWTASLDVIGKEIDEFVTLVG